MKTIRWFGLAAALAFVLGSAVSAQSVAGVAKKDKAAKTTPASRTFTDEDLKGRAGSVSTSNVPTKVQTAAKPKGRSTPARKSSPPPPSSKGSSAPANQMTPVGLGQTVKSELGDKGKR
jgi:hypothetical protein